MTSKNGIATRLIGRGDPEFDLLASTVDRENNCCPIIAHEYR